MKNSLQMALLFATGIAAGLTISYFFLANDAVPESRIELNDQSSNSNRNNRQSVSSAPNRLDPQIEAILYERALPAAAPFWLRIQTEPIRQHGETIAHLLEEDAVNRVWQQFTAAFPQQATPVIQHFYNNYQELRLFQSPGFGFKGPVFLLAGKPKDGADAAANLASLQEALTTAFPEAEPRNAPPGLISMTVYKTPWGEVALSQGLERQWLCTRAEALQELFRRPPDPPQNDPQKALLERYPQAALSLFVNDTQPPSVLFPASFYAFLRALKAEAFALFYGWPEGRGHLTLLAPASNPPEWVGHWPPLKRYVFTPSDPVGLAEVTWRRPGVVLQSAGLETSGDATALSPRSATGAALGRNQSFEGVEKDGPGNPQLAEAVQAIRARIISQIVPQGSTVGLNFFGFYQGIPAVTLVLPELDSPEQLMQRFLQNPQAFTESSIEIAKLPGRHYRLRQAPAARFAGLHELVVIERDATTYLFDHLSLAQHYLGADAESAPVREARPVKWRDGLQSLRRPAQVQALFTPEFFQYMLKTEVNRLQHNALLARQLAELSEALHPVFEPLALSAGYDNGEWFLDIQADSPKAHLSDTAVALAALMRFMLL